MRYAVKFRPNPGSEWLGEFETVEYFRFKWMARLAAWSLNQKRSGWGNVVTAYVETVRKETP